MTDTAPQAGAMEQWAVDHKSPLNHITNPGISFSLLLPYIRDCDAAFAALEQRCVALENALAKDFPETTALRRHRSTIVGLRAQLEDQVRRKRVGNEILKERYAALERQRDALLASVRMFLSRPFIGDALGEREIAITDAQWLEAQGAYEAAIAAAQGGGAVSKAVGMVPGEHRGRHE